MGQRRKPLKTVRDWPVYVSTMDWKLKIHSFNTKIFTRKPRYHLTAIRGMKMTTSASTTDGDRYCQTSEYFVVQMWVQTGADSLRCPRRLEEKCDYQAAKERKSQGLQSLQQSVPKQTARCSRLHPTGWASGFQKRAFMHWTNIHPEQSLEHQQDFIINFIDFKKAFDSVHRPSLWKILTYYGIPNRFINILKALYDNSSCCVNTATMDNSEYGIVWQKRNHPALITTANSRCTMEHRICREIHLPGKCNI